MSKFRVSQNWKVRPPRTLGAVVTWCCGHYISIGACGMWGARVRVQVFKREFHTHIHLDYARIEFLSYIKIGR